MTSVLAAYAFEPIQRRVLVNDDVSTFEGSNFKRVSRLYRFEREPLTSSALVYAASRVIPCVFVKYVVIGVVVTRVLEYHAFEPIQHRAMTSVSLTHV